MANKIGTIANVGGNYNNSCGMGNYLNSNDKKGSSLKKTEKKNQNMHLTADSDNKKGLHINTYV